MLRRRRKCSHACTNHRLCNAYQNLLAASNLGTCNPTILELRRTWQATRSLLGRESTAVANRITITANLRRVASLPTIRPLAVPRHSAQHAPVAMLAVWSRAAQNPGTCRCISCVPHMNMRAVARRRERRGLRVSWAFGTPTSTVLYTTAAAAGLAMDAKEKSERHKQWEKAFDQLRAALDRRAAVPWAPTSASDSEHSVPPTKSEDVATRTWNRLRLDSRLPGAQALEWPANTGRPLNPNNLPPQSLWAPDALRWSALRRRQTRKKLAMQELTVGLLVHDLVRAVDLQRFSVTERNLLDRLVPHIQRIAISFDEEAENTRTAFLADIQRLQQTHVSRTNQEIAEARINTTSLAVPSYVQDADGDFYEVCKQMNDGISQLLSQCQKGDGKEKALVVAKICHNLLVSTSAPDLHTFNVLIAGFTLWRRPKLVDYVISAFSRSKIRPNELVCTQILDHYAANTRPDNFTQFVARMRGVGGALSLASPAVTINEASQERLVRVSDEKVYQKVHPTPMVFDALIGGVMNFAGFDRALDIYYEMKADGWGLSIPGLTKLLADCIRRADWEGGTYVWEEINSIKTTVKPTHVAWAYSHMLSLCSVTGNTIAFNQVLNEVAKRGFDQKAIINGAMKTTHWAKYKTDNITAPAWSVDNLMIAVSSYVNDAKSPDKVADGSSLEDTEDDDYSLSQETSEEESAAPSEPRDAAPSEEDILAAKKEAWASWVEHELGEKPEDPEP
jgi:hypothetical protein